MRLLLLIACCLLPLAAMDIPVPNGALLAVRNKGVDTIMAVVKTANQELTAAVNAFIPINSTCVGLMENAINSCKSCVKAKCEARAKSVCEPNKFEKFLGKTVEAVKDVRSFIFKKVPNVVLKELPNKLIDITKDIHGFLKDKVIDKVVDIHKDIGKGVIDISKGLGKGVLDLGEKTVKEIGRVGERIGKEAGRVLESAGKEVGRFGEKVGKEVGRFFRRVFGKRSLRGSHAIRFRRSEPGCGAFESNPSAACRTYMQSPYCSTCGFEPMTGCPGYATAIQKIEDVQKGREWMVKIANEDFNILRMTFSMTPQGQFTNVKATVDLFGKQLLIEAGDVNPYLPDVAGPAVANAALEKFKSSV